MHAKHAFIWCREQLNACAEHGTRWVYISKDKQDQTVDNLACQLKSIEEVSNLWEAHYVAHPDEYAAVAYMRPDVQYQSDFPVHIIPELQVGCFHHFLAVPSGIVLRS